MKEGCWRTFPCERNDEIGVMEAREKVGLKRINKYRELVKVNMNREKKGKGIQ